MGRSTSGRAALLAALGLLTACGKRGDPLPPFPKTPQAITGLKLSQRGDHLVVSYVAPRLTTAGQRLPVLDVELQRADVGGDFAKVARKSRAKVAPGETVATEEPLPAPGTEVRIALRAIVSGQASALTPVANLTAQAPPPPPRDLTAQLGPDAVALAWTVPVLPPAPAPSPLPSPAAPTAGRSPSPAAATSPSPAATPSPAAPRFWPYRREKNAAYGRPLVPEPVAGASFEDATARPGQDLCYVVRTVVSKDPLVESADSGESCVSVRDVKPPATPSGVTALARGGAVDVSWSPVSDADVARYRVYRTSPAAGPPQRLAELPATETSFRDAAGAPGHSYSITAVDAAGNESPASRPAEVTQP